jgi:hypothetical protein
MRKSLSFLTSSRVVRGMSGYPAPIRRQRFSTVVTDDNTSKKISSNYGNAEVRRVHNVHIIAYIPLISGHSTSNG